MGSRNVLRQDRVVLDPSRIAAQIVSGIGFIGGGVIFVRKDIVKGLTTAATVWITAAIGMACGAGLPILAIAATAGHLIVIAVFPALERRLPKSRWAAVPLRILTGMEGAFFGRFSPLALNKTLPSADCRSKENGRVETSLDSRATRDMGGERMTKCPEAISVSWPIPIRPQRGS